MNTSLTSQKRCGLVNSNEFSSTRPVEQKLRLNEFKTLYKTWKRGIPWWNHLLLGVLMWLEEHFINLKIESTVDNAIDDYNQVDTTPTGVPPPIYSETDGEMRLTAPYFDENLSDHISYKQR